MKKNFIIFSIIATVAMIVSCTKEVQNDIPVPEGFVKLEFNAGAEPTKTSISGEGASKTVSWVQGDAIQIFYEGGSTTATASSSGTSTTFTAVVPQTGDLYAAYPAATFDAGTLTFQVPAKQDGSFAAGNFSASKLQRTGTSQFNNVSAFVKIVVTDASFTSISVKAVGGESICGKFPVSFSSGAPVIGSVVDGSSAISMAVNGAGTYYVALAPVGNLSDGLLVEYFKGTATAGAYYINGAINVTSAKIFSAGNLEERIGDYYVSVAGAGAKSGKNPENALDAKAFGEMINAVEGETSKNEAKAKAIDGATFHLAAGEYDLQNPVSMNFNAKVAFKGEGSDKTVITGADTHKLMEIGGTTNVTFKNIAFAKGLATVAGESPVVIKDNSTATFDGCAVSGNKSTGSGGAVYVKGTPAVNVTGCTFNDNVSESYGGVFFIEGGNSSFNECIFGTENHGNKASSSGGVIRITGDASTEAVFTDCAFAYNVGKFGGALSLHESYKGTVTISGGSILNCSTVFDGSSREGGAIRQDGGNIVAEGLKIDGCTSAYGGAYGAEGGTAQFKNCEFGKTVRNTATLRGGCFYANSDKSSVTEETHTFTDCWFSGQVNSEGTEVTGGGARVGNGASPTFTGCTFDNCTADGANGAAGAFWIAGSSHPVFTSCTFSNCSNSGTEKNGGAIAVSSATGRPSFTKCKFINCVSSYRGGAFYSESTYTDESMNFNECEFTGCYAPDEGAAVDIRSSKAVTYNFNDCSFHHNDSPWGALYSNNEKSSTSATINITGGDFSNNSGKTTNDDAWQNGAALYVKDKTTVNVTGVKFEGNVANNGPAIGLAGSTAVVNCEGCKFLNNEAKTNGGVFYAYANTAKFYCNNSVFDGNQAKEGAIFNIYKNNNSPTLYFNNSVFRNNHWGQTYGSLIPMRSGIKGVDIAFNNCTFIRNYINSGVSLSSNYQTTWFNLNSFEGSVLFSNSTIWGRTYQGIDKEGNTSKEQYGFIRVSSSDSKTLKLVNTIVGNSHSSGKAFTINGSPTISSQYCLFSPDANQSGSATWDESGTIHTAKARSDCYGGYQTFADLETADYVTITSLKGDCAEFTKQPTADVNQAIETANSSFYSWLGKIGALGKDCRGYTRNSTANWPGAYDNGASE